MFCIFGAASSSGEILTCALGRCLVMYWSGARAGTPVAVAGRCAALYVHRGLCDGTPTIHQPVRRQMNGDWELCSHYAPCLIIKGLELMHPASSSQINSSSLSLSAESSLFGPPDSHVSHWWLLPCRKLVNPAGNCVLLSLSLSFCHTHKHTHHFNL